MLKRIGAAALGITLVFASGCDKGKEPKTDQEKYSYAIGYQFAKNLQSQGVKYDLSSMKRALADVADGKPSLIPDSEMQVVMQKMYEERSARMKTEADANQKKGKEWLDANKSKEGVKTTPTGLQYKMVTDGDGAVPKEGDSVVVHYKGTLIDGTEFDSSYKRNEPIEFTLAKGALIDGWIEGLQLMKKGAKYEFYIPPELAYGERARPSIPPNSVLVFEVELKDVKPPAKAEGKKSKG